MNKSAIRLRPPRADDVPIYAHQLADCEVSRWLDDVCQRPLTFHQAEAFIFQDFWCRWAIECDGIFTGLTGLELVRTSTGTARLFIVIGRPELWRHGIGTAVLGQVLHQAFHVLGLRRIASDYLEPNLASAVIHERNGFREEGRLRQDAWRDGRWVDRILLSILRDEYFERGVRQAGAAVARSGITRDHAVGAS
jgi:RimJ/RimL family protein N-acetyltransferase